MRRLLAGAFLLAGAVVAWAQQPADPLAARPGSPIIEHTLDRPFADDLARMLTVVEVLRLSGNEREAELLERAQMRGRTARLIDAKASLPGTVREAIAAEATASPFGELARDTFRRIVVTRAGEARSKAAVAPTDARVLAPGAWIQRIPGGTARASVLLEVRNGLAAPLQRASLEANAGGVAIGMTCDLEPPLPPGQSRAVACSRDGVTEGDHAALARIAQEAAPSTFSIAFIETPPLVVTGTDAYREGDGSEREAARAQLAAARCEDKGTCVAAGQAMATTPSAAGALDEAPRPAWREWGGTAAMVVLGLLALGVAGVAYRTLRR